ncbi:MAG: glycosyltransferase [Tuberibacillus sp.]
MKKKLLFVALYMHTGGVEKSLLSVLSSLDYHKYDVDLCLFDHSGVLFDFIPREVNVLPPLFEHYSTPFSKAVPLLLRKGKFKLLSAKLLAALIGKLTKGVGTGARWSAYRWALPKLQKHYDVAISYLDFFCNYYVTEKVHADKKIVYNHMNYADGQKSGWPCPKLESKSFSASNYIVSVAESSRNSLISFFPEIKNKIHVIHNTVSKEAVEKLVNDDEPIEFKASDFNILTVARLVEEKGVLLALEACKILIDEGLDIKWYLIGKGPLQEHLKAQIHAWGLNKSFILLGEKANPYPYMAKCDVYCQPSKTEAHCVAVEEAMVLHRPIVVTDIPAFQEQVKNGVTGIRAGADPVGLASAIKQLFNSYELRQVFSRQLAQSVNRNEQEILKLLELIEEHSSATFTQEKKKKGEGWGKIYNV